MPGLPRVAVLAGALAIAALALFMLPALLGVGGSKPTGSATPTASSLIATATPGIASAAVPSQQVYVIKAKDTLSGVAKRFGITLAELLAANPAIKNPDKIALGQQIIIPPPSGGIASPSASP
jgi:LysM repeat protein